MRFSPRTLLGAALIATAAACAHRGGYSESEAAGDVAPEARTATLHVENNNLNDVVVYVAGEGQDPRRLGLVVATNSADFVLPYDTFVTGQLQIIARPLAGQGVARSGKLNISAGRVIDFRVQPDLAASMATIR